MPPNFGMSTVDSGHVLVVTANQNYYNIDDNKLDQSIGAVLPGVICK